MALLSEALRLTQWFDVFPLRPDGKPHYNCDDCAMSKGNSCPTPELMMSCSCMLCHSFYASSHDAEIVSAMWVEGELALCGRPLAVEQLIGIETGLGFIVVDFDKHGDHDGTATFERWREEKGTDGRVLLGNTWIARTGSHGLHFYYRLPEGMLVRNGQPLGTVGVDIKGAGGYVVAPPSRKENGGQYTWLRGPDECEMAPIHPDLLEAIVSRPERKAPSIERLTDRTATLNLFQWFMNTFPMGGGNRNNYLFQASCVAGECVELGFLDMEYARSYLAETATDAGLRHGEIRATVASGLNRGINNIRGTA